MCKIFFNMKIEINISDVAYSSNCQRLELRIQDGGKVKLYDEVFETKLANRNLVIRRMAESMADVLKDDVLKYLDKHIV